ncbi:pre-mRNA 3' end processing protein WDR33, partial [Camelus dromedarius]
MPFVTAGLPEGQSAGPPPLIPGLGQQGAQGRIPPLNPGPGPGPNKGDSRGPPNHHMGPMSERRHEQGSGPEHGPERGPFRGGQDCRGPPDRRGPHPDFPDDFSRPDDFHPDKRFGHRLPSDEEPRRDTRAVLPPEEGMVFLVLKTLGQRRILMLLMKQPEEEISEAEVGVPPE